MEVESISFKMITERRRSLHYFMFVLFGFAITWINAKVFRVVYAFARTLCCIIIWYVNNVISIHIRVDEGC